MKETMTLTAEELTAIESGQPVPVLIDRTECVLIRKDVYEKVNGLVYDDSDWSDAELRAVAARTIFDADTAGPIE
jgi:hypothetical protein